MSTLNGGGVSAQVNPSRFRNLPGMGEETKSTSRISGLDRVRGLCVVSMVIGHFTGGSVLSKAIHVPLWVDGAMGFVLVSGIVLGIVRR